VRRRRDVDEIDIDDGALRIDARSATRAALGVSADVERDGVSERWRVYQRWRVY
jgi:hypothetical protein